MGKNTKFDESGDSEELQALFDSFAPTPSRRRLELVIESPTSNGVSGLYGITGGDEAARDAEYPTDAGSWASSLAGEPVPEAPHVE
ncbi:MAG: hypothetical protein MUF06_18865, partial [Pirellulaceae bacterium]|nr:hypothetical protein [Pirellulaceae bacterium]